MLVRQVHRVEYDRYRHHYVDKVDQVNETLQDLGWEQVGKVHHQDVGSENLDGDRNSEHEQSRGNVGKHVHERQVVHLESE